jgi:hypothetical protein
LLVALSAGTGVYLLYTRYTSGTRTILAAPLSALVPSGRARLDRWLTQAGLDHVRGSEFVVAVGFLFALGAIGGHVVFGGAIPALAVALLVGGLPVASFRRRRRTRIAVAQ